MPSIQVSGAARFWWESNFKVGIRREEHAAVVLDAPDSKNPRQGMLLRDTGYIEKQPVISHYSFADDGLLTITTHYDSNVGEERCWFVTSGVRIRVSSVKYLDGVSMTTFCTELRCPSTAQLEAIISEARQRFPSAAEGAATNG